MGLRIRSWAVLSALLLSGCVDALIVTDDDAGPLDAGVDAAVADAGVDMDTGTADGGACEPAGPAAPGMGPEGPCEVRRPPGRPSACPPDEDSLALSLAFRRVELRLSGEGYDLDGVCSDRLGVAASCSPRTTEAVYDDIDGIDNSWSFLSNGLFAVDPMIQTRYQEELRVGRFAPMVQLEDWNGQSFDEQVSVVLAASARAEGPAGGEPAWEGNDTLFPAAPFYRDDRVTPRTEDARAYVADGLLVANFDEDVPLVLDARDRRLELRLRQAQLTATVSSEGLLSDMILSGRWPVDVAIGSLELMGLCPSASDPVALAQRRTAEGLIERWADIHQERGEEPEIACDAISMQVRFDESVPIRWGDVRAAVFPPTLCE